MADAMWEESAAHLNRLLSIETLPLGIRIIKDEKEIPEKGKRPRDFRQKMTLCQLITLARRLAWTTVALQEEIDIFFFPLIALGWKKVKSKEAMVK